METPIAQITLDWRSVSDSLAAEIFRAAFQQASVRPNRMVLEEALVASAETDGPVTVALAGADDFWGVYVVGHRWIVVDTEDGDSYYLTDLPADVLRTIPLPSS